MTAPTPRERFRCAPESLLLYAVSDDAWLGGRTLASCCAQTVRGGATFLQLRAKRATTEELISAYEEIRDELEREGLAGKVPFVIDDDVEAALAVGADGVHVGQSDESCASAGLRVGCLASASETIIRMARDARFRARLRAGSRRASPCLRRASMRSAIFRERLLPSLI